MRLILPALLLFVASSCNRSPQIQQIYLRKSGWAATDIIVNSRGQGRFVVSDGLRKKSGSFAWSHQQFRELKQRLESYRIKAVPVTRESGELFVMDEPCPNGAPFMVDAGAVYIRWTGPGIAQHYLANLGCDYKRNAKRKSELLNIVKGFPVANLYG